MGVTYNISNLLESFTSFQRPYLWRADFSNLRVGTSVKVPLAENKYYTLTSSIPDVKISESNISLFGFKYSFNGIADYSGSLSLSFILDESGKVYEDLLKTSKMYSAIIDDGSNVSSVYISTPPKFSSYVVIELLKTSRYDDVRFKPGCKFILYYAWINSIGGKNLSYTAGGEEYFTVEVKLNYSYYKYEKA